MVIHKPKWRETKPKNKGIAKYLWSNCWMKLRGMRISLLYYAVCGSPHPRTHNNSDTKPNFPIGLNINSLKCSTLLFIVISWELASAIVPEFIIQCIRAVVPCAISMVKLLFRIPFFIFSLSHLKNLLLTPAIKYMLENIPSLAGKLWL